MPYIFQRNIPSDLHFVLRGPLTCADRLSTAHGEKRDEGGAFSLRDSFSGCTYEKNVFGPAAPERQIEITHALIDLANTTPGRGSSKTSAKPMTIAFDEVSMMRCPPTSDG